MSLLSHAPAYELDPDPDDTTVGELIAMEALNATPTDQLWPEDLQSGSGRGRFQWRLGLGDEVRGLYDEDAAVGLDQALLDRPGVDLADWMDREVLYVSAPTLCRDGVLAAAARALLDPRVKG